MSGNRVSPSRPPGPGKVFYPMFTDVEGRRCLVVGGGPIGTEKVEKLLDHGAVIRLVSPQISDALAQLSVAAQQTADSQRQSNMAISQLNEAARGLQSGVSRFTLAA